MSCNPSAHRILSPETFCAWFTPLLILCNVYHTQADFLDVHQCCNIVNWALRNIIQWNGKRKLYNFVQENAFENIVCKMAPTLSQPLHWRHNERDGVSNRQPHDCLFNCLFRRRSKKTSKLRVTGLCKGNSPVTGELPEKRPVTQEMLPFDDVIMINVSDTATKNTIADYVMKTSIFRLLVWFIINTENRTVKRNRVCDTFCRWTDTCRQLGEFDVSHDIPNTGNSTFYTTTCTG